MTTQQITMADFKNAQSTINSIGNAITSIKKINLNSIGKDRAKASKIIEFTDFLTEILNDAEAIVTQASARYESRPQHLGNAAAARMAAIPAAIELEQKTAQGLIQQHTEKSRELEEKGFSDAEIKSIIPYPQAELDTHKTNIEALKFELQSIEAFLADQLLCDVSLIADAKLEPYLQSQNQAG